MKSNFILRLKKFGWRSIVLSPDFIVFIITISALYFYNPNFTLISEIELLDSFISTSATFFTIVLAGFAIITTFTDKVFIYAWIKINEYDNLITIFQINLLISLIVLSISYLLRFVYFSPPFFILLIGLFAYMVISLMLLVFFISNYSIQRGRLIQLEIEKTLK